MCIYGSVYRYADLEYKNLYSIQCYLWLPALTMVTNCGDFMELFL